MKAQVGDRLVVEGVRLGVPRRVGVIIAVRNPDGTPPYDVRWLDSGRESVVFPGAEARVEPSSTEVASIKSSSTE
jgi:Domain of unknown function (DUF1918)